MKYEEIGLPEKRGNTFEGADGCDPLLEAYITEMITPEDDYLHRLGTLAGDAVALADKTLAPEAGARDRYLYRLQRLKHCGGNGSRRTHTHLRDQ